MFEKYDKVYFEEGVARGVSGYTNYTWQPEFTIPLAHRIIRKLGIQPGMDTLEVGCAKGYLVKAMRLLDIDAWGYDVSRYAVDQVPTDTKIYVVHSNVGEIPFDYFEFDWILAKDVLEHFTEKQLSSFLKESKDFSGQMFVVVPLGDGEKYIIPQYEQDITHVLRWPLTKWVDSFRKEGWKVKDMTTDMTGIKDSWNHFQDGNAAFTLHRG